MRIIATVKRAIATGAFLSGAVLCGAASAQDTAAQYPSRQVTLVVPFAPGGGTDILARMIAKRLETSWGKPIVIENRPGSGGVVGAMAVTKAAPDGYTLFLGSGTNLAVNVSLYKKLSYDPTKDFIPLALVGGTPFVLVVNPALPIRSVADFIAYAKERPGQLSYATSGPGVPHHLFVELFNSMTGLKMTMVPYKGSLPALNDVAAGHVPLMMVDVAPALGIIQAGSVRALGVTTLQRFPTLPDVPPISDTVPGFNAAGWFMMAGHGAMPRAIAEKVHAEMDRFLNEPETREQLVKAIGLAPLQNRSIPELQKFIVGEIARWGDIVRMAGVEGAF